MELSVVVEMFYICTVQYGNYWPQMASECLKCGWYNWGTEFVVLFDLNLNSYLISTDLEPKGLTAQMDRNIDK